MDVGKRYENMKWITVLWLPALASVYYLLASIWDFPSAVDVLGILAGIATVLGVALFIASNDTNKDGIEYSGTLIVTESEDGATWRIELNDTPEELERKDTITFKKITENV